MKKTQTIAPNQHTLKELDQLQKSLYDLSARNPFINVSERQLWFLKQEDSQTSKAKKLYSKAQFYQKEYALETSLQVELFIKWKAPGKDNFFVSPLVYRTCKIVLDRKIEANYQLKEVSEELFVNPILIHCFNGYFDVDLPENVEHIETIFGLILSKFSDDTHRVSVTDEWSEIEEWQLIRIHAVGNFNYKKSLLGKDFEKIIEDPGAEVEKLLSGAKESIQDRKIKPAYINPLDSSQKIAIDKGLSGNLVIQGPPGTGKSHTIVSLIAGFLLQDKKVLFVSEKRSALDVVFERLKAKKLHYWTAYFNTEKDEKKAFYAHLKKAWEKIGELITERLIAQSTSTQSGELFDLYPGKILADNSALNGNLKELIDVLLAIELPVDELGCKGKHPRFSEWKEYYGYLKEFEAKIVGELKIDRLTESDFIRLNKSVFTENEPVVFLEKKLVEIEKTLQKIIEIQEKYELNKSLDEFTRFAITASILAMVNKNQLDLLNAGSKSYKSFTNWAKKYHVAKNKLIHFEAANAKWSQKPSMAEITELTDLLKHAEVPKGVFGFLKRNPAKLKEAFKDFDPNISKVAKLQLLESVREEWHVRAELEEIRIKMAHNLNVTDPEKEIDEIIKLRNKLDEVSENEYVRILEHERSIELIRDLENIHPSVQQINNLNRFIFNTSIPENIRELHLFIQSSKGHLSLINRWLPEIKTFFSLPFGMIDFLIKNDRPIAQLNAVIAYQNLLEQTRFEPKFNQLTGWDLLHEFKTVQRSEKEIFRNNKKEIRKSCADEIREFEEILSTPASKLNEDQKLHKKKYRYDKRTIVHEINKKQQHLPLISLFEECSDTLIKIQPVWMMNPLSVAGNLPCIEGLFDVVIFDESSQIPLEDAIPSVYRAKQVVVVGDSNQMPPSSFFTYKEDTKTILDQANFAFNSEMLKWHYRSEHPKLIEFSNRYFYDNELICLPPVNREIPIERILVDGTFEDRQNLKEAESIVKYYVDLLKQGQIDIGIIAFSREQEKAIEKELKRQKVPANDNLLLRNLENVQGIEKEIILISFGYAPNKEGVFRMNFGPVNQENGANRLNVLFTRAIRKMVVFTSVTSSDFSLSDNRGVQLLKDFLYFVEHVGKVEENIETVTLAHQKIYAIISGHKLEAVYYDVSQGLAVSCFVQHSSNKILLVDPGLQIGESEDLYNLLSVFYEKYAEVMIVLSLDIWKNYERVEKEVVGFLGS